jgi:hypothetical protein
MGDLRKQIRHLDAQVQGFLSVVRDFNERQVKQEKKIEELEARGMNRRLTMLEVYYRKSLIEMRERVETLEKKLEEEADRSGEDHVL